jgi:hypothetical protein
MAKVPSDTGGALRDALSANPIATILTSVMVSFKNSETKGFIRRRLVILVPSRRMAAFPIRVIWTNKM